MMSQNPILDELHAARQELLANVGGDLHRYVEEARQRALASGRPIAATTQKTDRSTEAAKAGGSAGKNPLSPPADR